MSGAGIYIKTPSGLVAAATVPGKQGSQGPQSSLTPGTITTGAAGTNAAATITGAGPVQTLNLTIPRGTPGSPTEFELRGTGRPEGVITAPVGTYYTDTAGTNGAWRWLKKSGIGNTGWKVEHGDTGWRSMAAPYGDFISGEYHLRRVGALVFGRLVNLVINPAAAGPFAFFFTGGASVSPSALVPLGFRGTTHQHNLVALNYDAVNPHKWSIMAGTEMAWVGSIAGGLTRPTMGLAGTILFYTDDAWPTTLPGVSA